MPKLVIFDMDGTILDTEPISLEGMIYAAKKMGHTMTRELFNEFIGRNERHARRLVAERFGVDFDYDKSAALRQQYIDDYIAKNGMPLKKGLHVLFDWLESLGIKKCVATSTARKNALKKLGIAGLVHRFESVLGGDDVIESKPEPEIFLKAAANCGTKPHECLVIEDSIAGATGSFRAGIPYILVPDIAPLTEEVKSRALAVCRDLEEVASLLRKKI